MMAYRVQAVVLVAAFLFPALVESTVRHYKFSVVLKNTTRLCSTKPIVTANGKFPGPTLYAREADTVIVRVINHVQYNATIHWHGIRQIRTGWADGPAYITQCPIQPGQSYVYNFTITGQRGTLLWHAHITWLRATLHGAIVILPKRGVPYPFPKPDKEEVIVLGEWWKSDVETVINQAMQSGLAPNVSDSHTINGHPGPAPNCFSQGFSLHVETGKTYLLRIVNAAVNEELFFKIAGHNLTVVEVDAVYTKPFKTDTVFIAPGHTTTNTSSIATFYCHQRVRRSEEEECTIHHHLIPTTHHHHKHRLRILLTMNHRLRILLAMNHRLLIRNHRLLTTHRLRVLLNPTNHLHHITTTDPESLKLIMPISS